MATDYWVDMTYYLGGRQRHKRMCAPFRTRIAAEDYIEEFLSHRAEIGVAVVSPEESGFFDAIDCQPVRRQMTDDQAA